MAEQARTEIGAETLDVVADRGYYDGKEILACETAGITVTLPKPMTSSAKAAGRFGNQDFVFVAADNVYRCPAGERLTYRYTNEEAGKTLHRYATDPALGADRAEQIGRLCALVVYGARSRAFAGPAVGQLVLLPDAHLVPKPHLY
jgi:hypothetical protein